MSKASENGHWFASILPQVSSAVIKHLMWTNETISTGGLNQKHRTIVILCICNSVSWKSMYGKQLYWGCCILNKSTLQCRNQHSFGFTCSDLEMIISEIHISIPAQWENENKIILHLSSSSALLLWIVHRIHCCQFSKGRYYFFGRKKFHLLNPNKKTQFDHNII